MIPLLEETANHLEFFGYTIEKTEREGVPDCFAYYANDRYCSLRFFEVYKNFVCFQIGFRYDELGTNTSALAEAFNELTGKKVVEWEFGVSYHRSHVARLLKELNWTPQQPIERAAQRDETEIRHWRTQTWFEIQKRASLERRLLVFIDESGFYLLPALLRSYAPRGETPVLKVFQTRDHLAMMSAITPQGWLFTRTRYEALNGRDSVHFLTHVRSQTGRKLLVIWDGSPIHRNADVRDYLSNGAAKYIHLERLPAYAPDLNPDARNLASSQIC